MCGVLPFQKIVVPDPVPSDVQRVRPRIPLRRIKDRAFGTDTYAKRRTMIERLNRTRDKENAVEVVSAWADRDSHL